GLVIDVNTALEVNATLDVASVSQEVSVSTDVAAEAVEVDTVSTQLGRGGHGHGDDHGRTKWPQLHGPFGASTRYCPNDDTAARFHCDGGCVSCNSAIGGFESGQSVHQRTTRGRKRFSDQWRRRKGTDEWRHFDSAQSGFHS